MRNKLVCKTKCACSIYVFCELFLIEYVCFIIPNIIFVGQCCLVSCFLFKCYLNFKVNCLNSVQNLKTDTRHICIAYELLIPCVNVKSRL